VSDAAPIPEAELGWGATLVRTSGLLLAVLFTVHVVNLFALNDIQTETLAAFTERWSSPTWRAADWALIMLAMVHGVTGLRPVIASGVRSDAVRGVVMALLYCAVAVLLALVTFVAFTFHF